MDTIVNWLPQLLIGLRNTAQLTAVSLLAGTAIGVCVGLLLVYGPRPVQLLARLYVDLVRGIPVLVLIFACYYIPSAFDISYDAAGASVVALSIFSAAHVAELVRGGIRSVAGALQDAGRAIGLSPWLRFRLVTVPLAMPRFLGPWVNTAVEVVKGTSLASLIGVADLLYQTQSAVGTTYDPLPLYLFAGVVFFLCNFVLSRISQALERHFTYTEA